MNRILLASATLILCVTAGPGWHQAQAKELWQRVYTGADSIIELNTATARFEPGDILRAEYRTILTNPESIAGDRGPKYKTRLEKIDFRLTDGRYRFVEISLLDSNGKSIQTKTTDAAEDWRVVKPGGITERLFNAACFLSPLGDWKVIAYRFAEGDPKDTKITRQLDKLAGAGVHLDIKRAQVANEVCSSPSFQDKDSTHDEALRNLGIDWKHIGIKPEDARTINVKCDGSGWEPPRSLLVKDNNKEEMLMLWEGVFLVLKRTPGGEFRWRSRSGSNTLKRRP
ncbi:MAG TPA: hypothetical protein VFR51_00610 [Pyrinomonadaceae bacterium]|nr:hypothetical protein [Pyrinomonadaceae bacterium]